MNWAEAIVIIVVVSSVAKVVRAGLVHNPRRDNTAPPIATPDPALAREVDELKERVRVLERIVTDERKSRDLADEIERLR